MCVLLNLGSSTRGLGVWGFSTLAVPSTDREFWCGSWIWWSRSSSLGVTAPSAPVTTGTTLAFTFHCLLLLLVYYKDVWSVGQYLPVCADLEVPQSLALLFSTTFWGVSHLDLGSGPYSEQMFLYAMPGTWLCRSVDACILHPATMCRTVSGASLHSLHLGSCPGVLSWGPVLSGGELVSIHTLCDYLTVGGCGLSITCILFNTFSPLSFPSVYLFKYSSSMCNLLLLLIDL